MIPFVDSAGGICTPIAFVASKGAITGTTELVVRDQPNLHVVKLATWNDDSWKHLAVVGLADLASGDNGIVLETGTPAGGSPPTVTKPTDTVTLGGTSLTLASATLHRTWLSTPDMIETHYVAKTGTMYVWWYLRTWSDGTQWLGYKVENNRSPDTGGSDAFTSFSDTVSVGGFTNGGVALAMQPNTAFYVERWVTGSDPGLLYKHDPIALSESMLSENWIRRTADDEDPTNFLGYAVSSYVPMNRGNHFDDWSGGGYKPHLGGHSKWDAGAAKYPGLQGWARIQALSISSFVCVFRDAGTHDAPLCTNIGVRGLTSPGSGPVIKYPDPPGSNGYVWDQAHNVNSGYVPYLLSGDFRFWETMAQHSAALVYYTCTAGSNSATRALVNGEIRGLAWQLRTIGQAVALAPEALADSGINAWAAEYRTLLETNLDVFLDLVTSNTEPTGWSNAAGGTHVNDLGLIPGLTIPVSGVNRFTPFFMPGYWTITLGHLLDIEPVSDEVRAAALLPLMRHSGKFQVGLLGAGGSDWSWDDAWGNPNLNGGYHYCVSADDSHESLGNVYPTMGDMYVANYGAPKTPGTSMLGMINDTDPLHPRFPIPDCSIYLTHCSGLLHAISKCVDYGLPGAVAAFARLVDADNFADFGGDNSPNGNGTFNEYIGYGATPTEGIVPRTWVDGVWPSTPTWYQSMTDDGAWYDFGDLVGADLSLAGELSTLTSFSGGVINTEGLYIGETFVPGPWYVFTGGGHVATWKQGLRAIGPLNSETPQLYQISADYFMSNVATDGGFPASIHSYGDLAYDATRNRLIRFGTPAMYEDGSASVIAWEFDFTVPNPMTVNAWTQCGDVPFNTQEGCGAIAGSDGKHYVISGSGAAFAVATVGASPGGTTFASQGISPSLAPYSFQNSACDSADGNIIVVGPASDNTSGGYGVGVLPVIVNIATSTVTVLHPTGPGPDMSDGWTSTTGIAWVEARNAYAVFKKLGQGSTILPDRVTYWLHPGPDPSLDVGWTWTQEDPDASGVDPWIPDQDNVGIYGRYRYVADPGLLFYFPGSVFGTKPFVRKVTP